MFALELDNVSKQYKNKVQALKSVSLAVEKGDFFALLGPNGAGKSTLLGILSSLVQKSSGTVRIMGFDLEREPLQAKRTLGVVPQEFNFNVFEEVQDILINQAGYYGLSRKRIAQDVRTLLGTLGLWEKRALPAGSLSGGMKRRLMIARALVHKPQLLLLDEPTAGVDVELRNEMWQFLQNANQEGTTIVLTTHYLEEAEQLCKNVAMIRSGEILFTQNMKSFLGTLPQEVLLIYLKEPLKTLPVIPNCHFHQIDPYCLEAVVPSDLTFHKIFEYFSQHGLWIQEIRQKTNRLEALFLQLVRQERS